MVLIFGHLLFPPKYLFCLATGCVLLAPVWVTICAVPWDSCGGTRAGLNLKVASSEEKKTTLIIKFSSYYIIKFKEETYNWF